MISAYQAALSGLKAFGTRIEANANNIANSSTEGYKRIRATLSETNPTGVRATVERVNTPGPSIYQETSKGLELVEQSNVDLATELPEMSLNTHFYKANLKTIQAVEEMTGSLLKIKS